jgi:glutamate/tyrosine decarboxylase-like PLP-dependent enzyme
MAKKQKTAPIFSGVSPGKVKEDLEPLVDFEEEGLSLQDLRQLLEDRLFPHLMQYDLRTFQSMFNVVPEEGAQFGAAIALQYNQGVTNWQVSPGGATLEELCCKALCRLFGLLPDSDATLMYCGTYANQHAIYLALHRHAEMQGFDLNEKGLQGFRDPNRLAVLTSEDAHLSLKHAVRTMGIGDQGLIPVKVDNNRRIDLDNLKENLDKFEGERDIFCVVATAGTTSSGSVDPIEPVAEVCLERDIWLHVDGAYGFAYCLVPEWKHLYEGKEQADSLSWDPHKQLGVPIPNSVLFVKRSEDFRRLTIFGEYFNPEGDPKPNPGLKSPPTTRPFSALPIVTSLRHQGMKKLIERLRAPLVAIKGAAEKIEGESGVELALSPDTGILCFRVVPDGFPEMDLDELQEKIYSRIMDEGKRTISKTKLGHKTVLRLVAVSPLLTADDLMETVSYSRSVANEYTKSL